MRCVHGPAHFVHVPTPRGNVARLLVRRLCMYVAAQSGNKRTYVSLQCSLDRTTHTPVIAEVHVYCCSQKAANSPIRDAVCCGFACCCSPLSLDCRCQVNVSEQPEYNYLGCYIDCNDSVTCTPENIVFPLVTRSANLTADSCMCYYVYTTGPDTDRCT